MYITGLSVACGGAAEYPPSGMDRIRLVFIPYVNFEIISALQYDYVLYVHVNTVNKALARRTDHLGRGPRRTNETQVTYNTTT